METTESTMPGAALAPARAATVANDEPMLVITFEYVPPDRGQPVYLGENFGMPVCPAFVQVKLPAHCTIDSLMDALRKMVEAVGYEGQVYDWIAEEAEILKSTEGK